MKTVSTKIYNKGLVRKEKENKIRLVDNNSIISNIFVRRKKFVRGSSLKLFKTRLQHRRDDFYTGNFLLATAKIRFKNAAPDLLQKLQNMRRRKKVISVPRTKISRLHRLKQNRLDLSLEHRLRRFSPKLRQGLMKRARSMLTKSIRSREKRRIKSWFVNPISNKSLDKAEEMKLKKAIEFLSVKLKKKLFKDKILPIKKQINSKENKLRKVKRFSKKFPVIVTGPRLWAGGKAYGCGMKKFVPKSSFILAKKRILSHFQEKTELGAENWQQLKRLKSVIPFRVLPAVLAKTVEIAPLWFKHNYSQVSMKKWKRNRAIGTKGRRRNPISIKSVFISTNKKLKRRKLTKVLPELSKQKTIAKPAHVNKLPAKELGYLKNENNAKSDKKANRYFPNKSNNKSANALPVRSSDQHKKKQIYNIHNSYSLYKKDWDRRQGKKDTTIQSQQNPKPQR